MNHPANHPTLLLIPTWYGGPPDQIVMPNPAADYEVTHKGGRSTVSLRATGEWVYQGIGPAEIVVSPAPF